eukprot:NODE_484_length_6933_cov_0.508341.p4 type:complete len:301 gc:universal NODE_484_length_6933_cov_0.508341:6733-5831(-)
MEDDYLENIDLDEMELDLTHSRLKNMKELQLERFFKLRSLGLRQNLFEKIESLPLSLEYLDVYDNKLKNLGILSELIHLKYCDLSYNLLREIDSQVFDKLISLEELFLISNDLKEIPFIKFSKQLRNLELGANRIKEMDNLNHLTNLSELWIGKNRIREIAGISALKNLRILSLPSNRIKLIDNLSSLENLEELYLSHNGIDRICGIELNIKLRVLDLGNNRITKLENLNHLNFLEELWLNDNQIIEFSNLDSLKQNQNLKTIYLERNPLQLAEPTAYRRKVILSLPQISQLDATFVKEM